MALDDSDADDDLRSFPPVLAFPQFQNGGAHKGRPPGYQNKTSKELRDLARQYGPAALFTLATIAGNSAVSPMARIVACGLLLERGYGKVGALPPNVLADDEQNGVNGPDMKMTMQDFATMDDATLAQALQDEVDKAGR